MSAYKPTHRHMSADDLQAVADYLYMRLALTQTEAHADYTSDRNAIALVKFAVAEVLTLELKRVAAEMERQQRSATP